MAATGRSSSSNVPSGARAAAGSGKLAMVAVGSIECLKKRCRQLRVLIHVNDHRKAVVVLHASEDGKPDHVLVQNVSPKGDASVQSTYRIDVSGETPESQTEIFNDWYTSFRMDTTGVLYDSDQNVIYGVPRGHPGGDVPRSLAILPPAPKKNHRGKAPAAESNSSLVDEPVLLVQTDQTTSTEKRNKFTFPDQRKRVKTMTKKDLESYFHITQKSAAHIGLSIGTTALKNLCRANDLPRWPYRQIASLDNKFNNNLKKLITGWNLGKAVQGVAKAFELRKEKEQFYQKIMSSMPEQLQGIDEIVHSLPEADDDIDIEDDEDNNEVMEDNNDENSDEN
uniref:RWP-RK domain-containing protein n=1 Tax=Oryza punctata TaxID=4537 RepID=A0A0E0M1T2_ORYPU